MAIAIAYAVQLWIVKPYRVPSQSMEQTLHVGDRILAARFLYHFTDPSRGDIIVFHPNGRGADVFQTDHASSQNYVKRLIGLPGEWVGSSGGKVYICETAGAGQPARSRPRPRAAGSSRSRTRRRRPASAAARPATSGRATWAPTST